MKMISRNRQPTVSLEGVRIMGRPFSQSTHREHNYPGRAIRTRHLKLEPIIA